MRSSSTFLGRIIVLTITYGSDLPYVGITTYKHGKIIIFQFNVLMKRKKLSSALVYWIWWFHLKQTLFGTGARRQSALGGLCAQLTVPYSYWTNRNKHCIHELITTSSQSLQSHQDLIYLLRLYTRSSCYSDDVRKNSYNSSPTPLGCTIALAMDQLHHHSNVMKHWRSWTSTFDK